MPNLNKYQKFIHIFGALYLVLAFAVVLIGPSLDLKPHTLPDEYEPDIIPFRLTSKTYKKHKSLIVRI